LRLPATLTFTAQPPSLIVNTIILGDISSLQWRGLANALASSPYILNAFIAGYISQAVSLENWRWGVSGVTRSRRVHPMLTLRFAC
jgi:hypothetical protein